MNIKKSEAKFFIRGSKVEVEGILLYEETALVFSKLVP